MSPRVAIPLVLAVVVAAALASRLACRPAPEVPRGGSEQESAARSGAAPAEDLISPAAGDGDEAREPASRRGEARLRVRSSAGIALARVELRDEQGAWSARALEAGGLALPVGAAPRAVRAPGHLEAELAEGAREVVLEPDALLELVAPGIKHVLSAVRPFGAANTSPEASRPAPFAAEACSWGLVAPDRYAFALSSAREHLDEAGLASVAIWWADGQAACVQVRAARGLRARWDVPRDRPPPAKPLVADVVGPGPRPVGRALVGLEPVADADGAARHVDPAPSLDLPWGRVVCLSHLSGAATLFRDLDRGRLHVEPVPLGVRYRVTVRDTASGAFGVSEFVHDGAVRRIDLEPPYEVYVRAVVPYGELPPRAPMLYWRRDLERASDETFWESMQAWRGGAGPDGRYRIPGPHALRGDPRTPPPRLTVALSADGFRPWVKTLDAGAARVVELVAELEPLPSDLVLAPGHGFASEAPPRSGRFATADGVAWGEAAIEGAREREDGSLVLTLRRPEPGGTIRFDLVHGAQGDAIAPRAIERALLDGNRPFRAGDDGWFVPVDVRRHALSVEVRATGPEGRTWTVGVQWGSIVWSPRGAIGLGLGVVDLDLVAPVGSRLWWGPSDRALPDPDPEPGLGGYRPMLAERERLVIP